jgi:competence protein ComEA
MKFNIVLIVAAAATGLLLASAAFASSAPSPESKAGKPSAAAAAATGRKHGQARIEPVDINSASKASLMKLPGLSAADAQAVIGGRPYRSKAQLVTRKVISESQYQAIKSLILARQQGVPLPAMTGKK